jgi:NADH dehydrogenase FAD-containing subunit
MAGPSTTAPPTAIRAAIRGGGPTGVEQAAANIATAIAAAQRTRATWRSVRPRSGP